METHRVVATLRRSASGMQARLPAASWRAAVVSVLLSCAPAALALDAERGAGQRIRKCVDAAGQVSYQGAPCAQHAEERWSAPLVPESPEQAERARVSREELARNMPPPQSRRAAARVSYANPLRPRAQVAPCEVAQRKAAEERERDWNRIRFDRLRELDEWVRSQCAD